MAPSTESIDRMRTVIGHERPLNIREFVEILYYHRRMSLGIFISVVLSALLWCLQASRIYEVSMFIEPPVISINDNGVQTFDTVSNIKAKVEAGAFTIRILRELHLPDKNIDFEVTQPKDTKLVKISLKRKESLTNEGQMILNKLLEALNVSYEDALLQKKETLENQIQAALSQISTKETEIKLKGDKVKILEDREKQFQSEIKDIRLNADRLLAKKEAVFDREKGKDDVSSLFYASTIQQNLNYSTQLQNDLTELKTKKENTLNDINNLKNDINREKLDINNMQRAKSQVRNIIVIQEPSISLAPVGPKRLQIMIVAAFLGLLLAVSGALLRDYWINSSRRYS